MTRILQKLALLSIAAVTVAAFSGPGIPDAKVLANARGGGPDCPSDWAINHDMCRAQGCPQGCSAWDGTGGSGLCKPYSEDKAATCVGAKFTPNPCANGTPTCRGMKISNGGGMDCP